MIELNLLPQELKKKKRSKVVAPKISVWPIAGGIVVIVILVHLSLIFLSLTKKNLLKTLESMWVEMQPQRKRTEKLTGEIAYLEKRVMAIREIAKPGLNWTKLLSGLNQAVIPNIWLSSIRLKFQSSTKAKKEKETSDLPVSMDITGYALGNSEEATAYVGKFITSLKTTEDFSNYFDMIELQNMNNSKIAGEEVMVFRLDCRFKPLGHNPVSKK